MNLIVNAFSRFLTLAIILVAISYSGESQAAGKHFLDSFSGSWKGKGIIITSDGGAEEAIRCRLRNRADSNSGKLTITGNCGIGGVLIPMNGWIQQKNKSSRYVASLFKSLAFLRIDSFSGKLSGKKLRLYFKGQDKTTKTPISASVLMFAQGKNKFNLQLTSTDPNTKRQYNVGTIRFSARK